MLFSAELVLPSFNLLYFRVVIQNYLYYAKHSQNMFWHASSVESRKYSLIYYLPFFIHVSTMVCFLWFDVRHLGFHCFHHSGRPIKKVL